MSPNIQQQLKTRMESKSLSPAALEKKAGLKRGVIGNILRGSSKNPTSETLVAIADILGCSLDDLLNRSPVKQREDSLFSLEKEMGVQLPKTPWDADLYSKTVSAVILSLQTKNLSLSAEQAMILIKEVYQYSLSKNQHEVDKNFAEWLASKL